MQVAVNHEFLFKKAGFTQEQKRGLAHIWHVHVKRRHGQDCAFQSALNSLAALPSVDSVQVAMRLLQASPATSGGLPTATGPRRSGSSHTPRSVAVCCESGTTQSTHAAPFKAPGHLLQRSCSGSGSACSSAHQEVLHHCVPNLRGTLSENNKAQPWQPLQSSHLGCSFWKPAPLPGGAAGGAQCDRAWEGPLASEACGGLGKRKIPWGDYAELRGSDCRDAAGQLSLPDKLITGSNVGDMDKVHTPLTCVASFAFNKEQDVRLFVMFGTRRKPPFPPGGVESVCAARGEHAARPSSGVISISHKTTVLPS